MKLHALLLGVANAEVVGPADVDVSEVRDDSRAVGAGDLFAAVPGVAANGMGFVADAITRGARVLLVETGAGEVAAFDGKSDGTIVRVPSVRHALGIMAANRFATPGQAPLTLTAVTGTNGKTTTTYLLEAMLHAAGLRAGVVGTIAYRVGGPVGGAGFSRPAPLTTPGALALHALFAEMRAAGASDAVLEASSHALHQGRLEGCRFRVAGLTNLTQDHLDYHGTMDAYLDAKAILFERLLDRGAGVAVLPIDRPEGVALRARARATGCPVLGVAMRPQHGADVAPLSIQSSSAGLRLRLGTPDGPLEVVSPLVGAFNLANIVLAVGMAVARGLSQDAIVAGLRALPGVPGRLERVPNRRDVLCVVDYAHSPDAIERAIEVLRPLVAPGGRLITVFGCGGDRDRGKRPGMAAAATRGSDLAIVTSDNPRTEDPASILAMIVAGIDRAAIAEVDAAALPAATRGFCVIADRRAAIRAAVVAARAGDVVLLAGKGHEDYQIVGRDRLHFDDREEATAAFATAPPRASSPAESRT